MLSRTKAVSCELGSVWRVWRRIAILPYTIVYWLLGIAIVVGTYHGTNPGYSSVLLLLVWQIYLPAVVTLFSVKPALRDMVLQELSRRTCRPSNGSDDVGVKDTDLWLRLFNHSGPVFALSSGELEMVVAYFETCHKGVDGERWPIWWHDDLCISGTQTLENIYVHDMNILLCSKEGMAEGNDDWNNATVNDFRRMLQDFSARVHSMYQERVQHPPPAESSV